MGRVEQNYRSAKEMQPEKRKTVEFFFRSFKKKNRDDGLKGLNVIESSSSDVPNASSQADKLIDLGADSSASSSITIASSLTDISQEQSVADDISKSCYEFPI